MKHYLALDIGNVLCTIDFNKFTSSISKYLNISVWEATTRVNFYQKMVDVGLVTMSDVLRLEFKINSQPIIDDLLQVWNNQVLQFNKNVLDYICSMGNKQQIQIALLSNIGLDHVVCVEKYINTMYNNTDFSKAIRYYSCNVGVRKPQSLYYQSFLQQYPEFKGCIYLDDRDENLQAAIPFEFQSAQFDLDKITDLKYVLNGVENRLFMYK